MGLMTTGTLWIRAGANLFACALLASASGADAQTCRTSLSTGMILCDNGATAHTSPVTGTTTFTDGRTARTNPVNGTTRFSDGTSFRTVPVEIETIPVPPASLAPDATLLRSEVAIRAPQPAPKKPAQTSEVPPLDRR